MTWKQPEIMQSPAFKDNAVMSPSGYVLKVGIIDITGHDKRTSGFINGLNTIIEFFCEVAVFPAPFGIISAEIGNIFISRALSNLCCLLAVDYCCAIKYHP